MWRNYNIGRKIKSYTILLTSMYFIMLYVFHTSMVIEKKSAEHVDSGTRDSESIHNLIKSQQSKGIKGVNKHLMNGSSLRGRYRQLKEVSHEERENRSKIKLGTPGLSLGSDLNLRGKINKLNKTESEVDRAKISQVNRNKFNWENTSKTGGRDIGNLRSYRQQFNGGNRFPSLNEAGESCKNNSCSNSSNLASDGKAFNMSLNLTQANIDQFVMNATSWGNYFQIIELEFQKVSNFAYVLSVFFDDRNKSDPKIRIFAMKKRNVPKYMVCYLETGNGIVKSMASQHEMCENHSKKYGGWIYSCSVPVSRFPKILPKQMFIKTDDTDSSGAKIDLIPVASKATKEKLALCVPPLYGDISMSVIIQFVELHRIVGVSHFIFYVHKVTANVERLLRYYASKGIITVVKWSLPAYISEDSIWNKGQLLSVHDCLYRSMPKFEYVGFLDLDEIMVPVKYLSMVQVLETLDRQFNETAVAGYSFQSAFFSPAQVPDPRGKIPVLQLLDRTELLSSVRTKVIVKPDQVYELGIHHVSKLVNDTSMVKTVPSDHAKIHHYRMCDSNFDKRMVCEPTIHDETVLNFAEDLILQYKSTVQDVVKFLV